MAFALLEVLSVCVVSWRDGVVQVQTQTGGGMQYCVVVHIHKLDDVRIWRGGTQKGRCVYSEGCR